MDRYYAAPAIQLFNHSFAWLLWLYFNITTTQGSKTIGNALSVAVVNGKANNVGCSFFIRTFIICNLYPIIATFCVWLGVIITSAGDINSRIVFTVGINKINCRGPE